MCDTIHVCIAMLYGSISVPKLYYFMYSTQYYIGLIKVVISQLCIEPTLPLSLFVLGRM